MKLLNELFMKRINLMFIFLILVVQMCAQDTVRISDFGARPYTYQNSVKAFQRAIEACKRQQAKYLVLDSGRYDLWPEGAVQREYFISNTSTEQECPSKIKTIGLFFDNVHDLTIEGNGALIMCHGKMITYAFDHCENIKMHNLHVDFEHPTMSELRCLRCDEKEVEFEVNPDTRFDIIDGRIVLYGEGWRTVHHHCVEYNPQTDMCHYGNEKWIPLLSAPVRQTSVNRLVFEKPGNFKLTPGSVLTIRDTYRDQVGAFLHESKNITLSRVGMHFMHGLGIVSQYSRDITMDSVVCAPRAESGRIMASSADMMHFSGCSGRIRIENCYFSGAHDDPINIHGTNLRMMKKIDDYTVCLRFMHGQSYGFDAFHSGDTVAFVKSKEMKRFALGRVKSVERISSYEVNVHLYNKLPEHIAYGMDCMENMTCTPEVEIRNNFFTRTVTRGLLCTTPRRVVIAGNTFQRTGMSAILVEADSQFWFESGSVCDMTIRGNMFIDCGYNGGPGNAMIAFNPSNNTVDSKHTVHSNIRIEGNTFRTPDYPVLYVKSVNKLKFSNNTIEHIDSIRPLSGSKTSLFFNGSSNVVISDNRFAPDALGKNVSFKNMTRSDLKSDIKPKFAE